MYLCTCLKVLSIAKRLVHKSIFLIQMSQQSSMSFMDWLNYVQGLQVSHELLFEIKQQIEENKPSSNRDIYKLITELLQNRPDVDPMYVYQSMLGMYIRPLSDDELQTIMTTYQLLSGIPDLHKVPNMYVLSYICTKKEIEINIPTTYNKERQQMFDRVLTSVPI